MKPPFAPLPPVPDHVGLEVEVLEWWERERVFEQLRERNRGGPRWSFIDGPITANNPMGVHHAWGRSLKDVFQRYKAMRGFDQRYQNGFDCQGLWVEVEVEKALGLNSKQEIEAYGLAEFAARCRERVAHFAEVITQQSRRLGMWMDWDNDYYTFSDTNIEYIWRFLKEVHARGWLYTGHRSTPWCPRCGTSISQHEVYSGEYKELDHPSLYVRFPLKGRDGESLVIWTTTPWTLPANVAAAVRPDAEYGLSAGGNWSLAHNDGSYVRKVRGEELVGLEYEGPFDATPAQAAVTHRVIPWADVSLEEGSGIVHIAPGAGTEDFELSRVHDLPVLVPIDESGRMLPDFGAAFEGLTTEQVEEPVIESLRERGLLLDAGRIVHRYPTCWRCGTPLLFRVVGDWFIACDDVRQPMLDANAQVEWTPAFYSKRMDDWLRNMGDWNISRKRYFGLPLPIYPCGCGHVNVVGSKAELAERATAPLDGLQELHRPWIDAITIRCESCGREDVSRIPEVGDAWLDAGIVPLSTLGWGNERYVERGYATGAAEGLTGADLPDHAYWEQWFPADWISEMREQIRLWFYAISFMSVTLTGRSPYNAVLTYEKVRDEHDREMHRSWGNAIEVDDALDRIGADVMRWMYAEQVPSQNLKFGYTPAADIKRRLLTLWNSIGGFFVPYANIEDFRPRYDDLVEGPVLANARPLDRWLLARTQRLLAEVTDAYERFWTPAIVGAFESFVDDLSNWYIRRSRRRFYSYDDAAFRTLWYALAQALRVVAPVMPFLAEHLWQALVARPCEEAPRSVFLAPWPEVQEKFRDDALVSEIEEVIRVVKLGRKARDRARIKHRQPLPRIAFSGAPKANAHRDEISDELRVKNVVPTLPVNNVRLKPNLPLLGPRLGRKLAVVRKALEEGEFELLSGGDVLVAGERLKPEEVLGRERVPVDKTWIFAEDDEGTVVALDTEIDDELRIEGRVLDLIHHLNTMRKEAGLELTDRIVVRLPREHEELLAHEQWIKDEVLATKLELDGESGVPQIAKA